MTDTFLYAFKFKFFRFISLHNSYTTDILKDYLKIISDICQQQGEYHKIAFFFCHLGSVFDIAYIST